MRLICLFLGYAMMVMFFVTLMVPDINTFGEFLESIFFSIIIGGIPSGVAHFNFAWRKMMVKINKMWVELGILLGIWLLLVYEIAIAVPMLVGLFFGWIFLIIDTILLILYKPFVFKNEIPSFIYNPKIRKALKNSGFTVNE